MAMGGNEGVRMLEEFVCEAIPGPAPLTGNQPPTQTSKTGDNSLGMNLESFPPALKDVELDKLAFQFFKTFARIEYALKAAGYRRTDKRAGLQADWGRFADSVHAVFSVPQSDRLKAAIRYLTDQPPRKQAVRGDALEWVNSSPRAESEADLVLKYVRQVRNNLFHGGKFNGRWFDFERSKDLMHHSLVILEACLAASDPVREAYCN